MRDRLAAWRIVPVVVIEDHRQAVPLARALAAGGIGAIEITLRTAAAWDAAAAIAAAQTGIALGIGTVTHPDQLERARRIGASFAVSPGSTPALRAAARACGLPYLPGVATVSEMMATLEDGITTMKLFPAEVAGGIALLKSVAMLFGAARFCPTGGVGPANLADYLAQPNVVAVGGSWLAPTAAMRAGDWAQVEHLARTALETAAGGR